MILCAAGDVGEGRARGFTLDEGAAPREVLVVRKQGRLFAYVNSCPHLGTPLDMFPDRLLTRDGMQLLCSTHGARFRIEDGHCVEGPCKGKRLAPLTIHEVDGAIVL